MSYENHPERERIIHQMMAARTLPQAEAAAAVLRPWIQDHPDDLNADDAPEPLAILRQGFQAEAAREPSASRV
jgi:hypothetical protein